MSRLLTKALSLSLASASALANPRAVSARAPAEWRVLFVVGLRRDLCEVIARAVSSDLLTN
jgi:hypothetical protein